MKSLRHSFVVALFSALHFSYVSAGPVITATKDDNTAAGVRKQVGNTITYTINVTNTGDAAANTVQFTDATPTNTSDVAGGVSMTPVAVDDTYSPLVIANTSINTATSTGFSVVTNDGLGYSGGAAVTSAGVTVSANSPAHGTVSMTASGANVGKFTYTPTPGYTGADSFTYTISNGVTGGNATSITGTVSLTVAGPVIWYVNPSAGAGGNGTLQSPFNNLAAAITAIGNNTGQKIFLYSTATTQTGNFVLKQNGWLVGQAAVGTDFVTVMGISSPSADTATFPSINNGTKPLITNSVASTITLGENNTILGVALTNTGGGFAVAGSAVNAGTIGNANDVTLGSSGTSSGAFSLTTSGNGIFSINAPITTTAGHSVSVASRTAGTVTFNAAISDTATGISLTTNGSATINFAGGLNLSTSANDAFTASGGGTVNATQNNSTIVNTITTTTGTALNLANTTIGASGMTFRSITAGTTVDSAGQGIVLDNTGATAGLTVTGNNSAGTGGTIQHKNGADIHSVAGDGTFNITGTTGVGIFLRNTKSPSFALDAVE